MGLLQRDDGALLLEQGYDDIKQEPFYRLLGGGIEFGETGIQAIKREFLEELGLEIQVEAPLGTSENIFTFNGTPGHQIILLYKCRFADEAVTQKATLPRVDGTNAEAVWRTPAQIKAEGANLYPEDIWAYMA